MWQPSPGAKRMLDKLVVNVIDGGELPVHHNMAGVSFDASTGPVGQVQADGSMAFDDTVGRAFETAAERGRSMTMEEVDELRHAIRAVTFTALDKRIEDRQTEPGKPVEMRLDAGTEADQFLNDGLRHADWAINGDRICYRLSPELGSRLRDVMPRELGQPVAEDAAVSLADQYARACGEWTDNAVRDLLKAPREQVFETVVDAKLAAVLRDDFEPVRDALAELRGRLANDVRTEFQQLSGEPHLRMSDVQERVAAACERVDDAARIVKETVNSMPAQQTGRPVEAGARRADSTPHRWTSFGR
ncbi:hypothetical protein ACWF0M_23770 [Kribbella sp. NPDC055110]